MDPRIAGISGQEKSLILQLARKKELIPFIKIIELKKKHNLTSVRFNSRFCVSSDSCVLYLSKVGYLMNHTFPVEYSI